MTPQRPRPAETLAQSAAWLTEGRLWRFPDECDRAANKTLNHRGPERSTEEKQGKQRTNKTGPAGATSGEKNKQPRLCRTKGGTEKYRIERTVERELIPMAKALNLGVTAWSPLANGVLTGKYHGRGSSEPGRMSSDMMKEFLPEQ